MQPHLRWILFAALTACTGDISSSNPGDGGTTSTCVAGRSYLGFDGKPLEAKRAVLAAGADRLRLKPYGALADEYSRALGLSTFDTSAFAATFGKPPARWSSEPSASANTIYAAFALAFDACSKHTATDGTYASAPTMETASGICRDNVLHAWHREATDAVTSACATYAVEKTNPADDPRRRWAYSCAAVFSASGFLAY